MATTPSRILDYLRGIAYEWPVKYPGLTIKYGYESWGSIYVMVKYNGFVQKQIFDMQMIYDNNTDLDEIRYITQAMRDAIIQKGEEKYKITISTWDYMPKLNYMPKPKKIILNDPATIILWKDGTKTIVKKNSKDKKFDPEKGIALCYMKKCLGNKGNYNNIFKEWIK